MTDLIAPSQLPAHGITYSNSYRLRLEKQGAFPKRIKLSAVRNAYVRAEIEAWLQARIDERDASAASKAA